MIQQFLKYGNTFCAVEHSFDQNSSEIFYSLQLNKTKKELVVNAKEQFHSKPELLQYLKKQKHLFLIVNDQQVLLKKVDGSNDDIENIVKRAFPTIKIADFYYEVAQNGDHNFIAICRKEYVDGLIFEYQSNDVSIIGFSLHNLAITSLIPFVKQSEIKTSNSVVSFFDKTIQEIKNSDIDVTQYNINDLKISNKYILSLSGILSYFYNNTNNKFNFSSVVKQLKGQYNNHRFYSLGIKIALGFIFTILLVNFIIFSNSYSNLNDLTNELQVDSSYKSTLIRLQERVDKKIELSKNMMSLSSSKTSWYLNELGKSVPAKLQLTVIDFQPLSKSIKKGKELAVEKNTILVKGISKNNNSFSNWTAALELKDWIEEIIIVSHGKGKNTTSTFEFTIKTKG